jgi:hypothetical protein
MNGVVKEIPILLYLYCTGQISYRWYLLLILVVVVFCREQLSLTPTSTTSSADRLIVGVHMATRASPIRHGDCLQVLVYRNVAVLWLSWHMLLHVRAYQR